MTELSAYKIKWHFIFCNFKEAADKAKFKKKMKNKHIYVGNLKQYNLMITHSIRERNIIFENQPKFAEFTELLVTDKQFGMIKKYTNIPKE